MASGSTQHDEQSLTLASNETASATAGSTVERVPVRVRVPLGWRWLAAAVLIPIVLGVVAGSGLRNNVENNLTQRIDRQLGGAGYGTVDTDVNGRDVSVFVPTGVPKQKVIDLIKDVDGVGNIKVRN